MTTKLHPILVPTLAVGLATTAGAQIPAPAVPISSGQGMWTADALGVQFDDGTGSRLAVRDAGVAGTSLGVWEESRFGVAGIDHPDYSPRALFAHWVPALFGELESDWDPNEAEHNPILGGWSTGGDITPGVDANGLLELAPPAVPAWYNLSIAVDGLAAGVNDSVVAQAIARTGRASDHVFSYTAYGSELIRSDFVHTNRTEFTGSQIGGLGSASTLTALDWGMGLISETPGAGPSRLQPTRNRLYFSLTQEWLGYGPGPIAGGISLRSNEIYGMEWDGASWSAPAIAFSTVDLFGAEQPAVELDALSVFASDGPIGQEATAVFSLTPESVMIVGNNLATPNQILVTQRGIYHQGSGSDAQAATLSVATSAGVAPVSEAMGLVGSSVGSVPDNVTGLCGRDPSEGQNLDIHKGSPTEGAGYSNGAELSLLRHRPVHKNQDSDGEVLRTTISGIDESAFDLAHVEITLSIYSHDNGNTKLVATFPPVTTWGSADAELLELVIPFTLAPGTGDELRAEATVTGIVADPLQIVPMIATTSTVSLGLD